MKTITSMRLVCFAVLVSVQLDVGAEEAPPSSVITLDQIWANQIPGTRDIQDLEPEQKQERLQALPVEEQKRLLGKRLWVPLISSLCADLSKNWPAKGEVARSGFAVSGKGRQALQNAFKVLAKGADAEQRLRADSEISLVFFSYQCGAYLEILRVEKFENTYTIAYRLIRPTNQILSAHLALIPVGRLVPGKYYVEVKQERTGEEREDGSYSALTSTVPDEKTDEEWGKRFVSHSYSFEVVNDRQ